MRTDIWSSSIMICHFVLHFLRLFNYVCVLYLLKIQNVATVHHQENFLQTTKK